ncbi:hypothetical protein K9K77_02080 [Candidatus Babeliales bacterium]|nr:hypothetical protein [Candidatus Babeliales bacterium]
MKSYSKVLLISALLSCVAVQAHEEKDESFDVTRLAKKPVQASMRWTEKMVPALVLLYISKKIVDGTPLSKISDTINSVPVLKTIEGYIPGAAENEMLKKITTVGLGALGITCVDTVLKQKNIRGLMEKHCPSIVKMLDKAFDFLGIAE